jgi:hypothetical protein
LIPVHTPDVRNDRQFPDRALPSRKIRSNNYSPSSQGNCMMGWRIYLSSPASLILSYMCCIACYDAIYVFSLYVGIDKELLSTRDRNAIVLNESTISKPKPSETSCDTLLDTFRLRRSPYEVTATASRQCATFFRPPGSSVARRLRFSWRVSSMY